MELLLSHWHCILPLAVILVGMLLMRRGNDKNKEGGK